MLLDDLDNYVLFLLLFLYLSDPIHINADRIISSVNRKKAIHTFPNIRVDKVAYFPGAYRSTFANK